MQQMIAKRTKGDADVRAGACAQRSEVLRERLQGGARQRDRKSRALGYAQKLRRSNVPAQRMQPAQITDPCDQLTGDEIVPTDVAEADLAILDAIAQLASKVEPRKRAQLNRVAVEIDCGGGRAPRLRGRRTRVIEQRFRRRRVETEHADAGVWRQAKLSIACRDGLAQARADCSDRCLDRFALGRVEHDCQDIFTELSQIPTGLRPGTPDSRAGRAAALPCSSPAPTRASR